MRPYPTDPNDVDDQMRWWIEAREEGDRMEAKMNAELARSDRTMRWIVPFMVILAVVLALTGCA